MSVSRDEVRRIARLARLDFTPDEEDRLAGEMSSILDYMALLREVDVEGVAPLHHVHDAANVTRADVPAPPLSRDTALANAPDHDGAHFRVPRVIG